MTKSDFQKKLAKEVGPYATGQEALKLIVQRTIEWTLNTIAAEDGWEESRDYWAKQLLNGGKL